MVTVFLLFFFLFLLLLLFLLPSISAVSSFLMLTARTISFFQLFPLKSLLFVKFLYLLFSHSEISSTSSKSSWSPAEQSSTSFIVNDDFRAINFAIVSIFEGSSKIILVVKLDESIAFRISLKVAYNSYRFNDTVFLQLHQNLPQISS